MCKYKMRVTAVLEDWEVIDSGLSVNYSKELGHGSYGSVYKGKYVLALRRLQRNRRGRQKNRQWKHQFIGKRNLGQSRQSSKCTRILLLKEKKKNRSKFWFIKLNRWRELIEMQTEKWLFAIRWRGQLGVVQNPILIHYHLKIAPRSNSATYCLKKKVAKHER